jgi:hypothetical protein
MAANRNLIDPKEVAQRLSLDDYLALTQRNWTPGVSRSLRRSVQRGLEGGAIFFLDKGPSVLDSRGAAGLAHRIETIGA